VPLTIYRKKLLFFELVLISDGIGSVSKKHGPIPSLGVIYRFIKATAAVQSPLIKEKEPC
jgi:hypothetical protein